MKKNLLYNYFIIFLLLISLLIPEYVRKDIDILQCQKCNDKKLIKYYSYVFLFGIPELHYNLNDHSRCIDKQKHILNKTLSSDISANKVLKLKYRILIFFIGLVLFFYKFIYLKFLKDNILKIFKYSRVIIYFIYFFIIMFSLTGSYLILKYINEPENIINNSLLENIEKKQILKNKLIKNNFFNKILKKYNVDIKNINSFDSTNDVLKKLNQEEKKDQMTEQNSKNMDNPDMNKIINELLKSADNK